MKTYFKNGFIVLSLLTFVGCAAHDRMMLENHIKNATGLYQSPIANASASATVGIGGSGIGTIWSTKDVMLTIVDAMGNSIPDAKVRIIGLVWEAHPDGWSPVDKHGKVHLYLPFSFPEPITIEVTAYGITKTNKTQVGLVYNSTVTF